MKIEQLENGIVRITPDAGKELYNTAIRQRFSEAIEKQNAISIWTEVNEGEEWDGTIVIPSIVDPELEAMLDYIFGGQDNE